MLVARNEHHDSARGRDDGTTGRARWRFRWRTHHGVPRPVARRCAETPGELRLDVGCDVHEGPALARRVLAVRRGQQAKGHRDAREAAAGAGTRDAAGRVRAATREKIRARGHFPPLPRRHPPQTPHRSTPRVECLPVFPSRRRSFVSKRCCFFTAVSRNAHSRNAGSVGLVGGSERQNRFFAFSLRISYEHQSRKSSIRKSDRPCNFDASRDISFLTASRSHSTALARRVFTNAAPARRSSAQARRLSRSTASLSNFYVRCRSALGCAQSPRTAPFQGNSEVSRPRRQVHRYVRPSPFPTRERSARRALVRDVVCQAVRRPHATQARLLSVAFGRINIPRWWSQKNSFPRSRRSRLRLPAFPPRRRPPRARHGRRR